MSPAAGVIDLFRAHDARALIDANAHEASDLVAELMSLLDRAGNEGAFVAAARLIARRIADRLGQLMTLERLQRSGGVRADMWSPVGVLEELEHEAIALAGNRIDICVRTPDLVPQYWFFDRELAGMALGNALHNALAHATRCVSLELCLRDGELGFAIGDDGGAFPHPLLGPALAPVERGEINGSALGIHFARLVAAAHSHAGRRGRVELSNRSAGSGTLFVLWLP